MIGGGVRAGVSRAQDRGERFAGLVQVAAQRVKPIAVLVVAGRQLLLRMRGHERRVDVQRDRVGAPAGVPHPGAGRGPGGPDPVQQLLVDRLQHPVDRRLRRPGAEQALLPAVGIKVGHAIAAVGEHHRHVAQHPAGIVRRAPLARLGQRPRQRAGQPEVIRQLDQQRDARVRHQPLSVRRHFYRPETSRWLHQLCPPGSRVETSAIPILTAREDVPAIQRQPATGASRLSLAGGSCLTPRGRGRWYWRPRRPSITETRHVRHPVESDRGRVPGALSIRAVLRIRLAP